MERVASVSSKYANRSMNVVIKNLPLRWVNDQAWKALVRYQCFLRALPTGTRCTRCNKCIDDLGEHFLTCQNMGQGAPHHAVQTALMRSLVDTTKGLGGYEVTPTPQLAEYMRTEEERKQWLKEKVDERQQQEEKTKIAGGKMVSTNLSLMDDTQQDDKEREDDMDEEEKELQVTQTPVMEEFALSDEGKMQPKMTQVKEQKRASNPKGRKGMRRQPRGRQQKADNPQADVKMCETNNNTTTLFDIRTCAMTVPARLDLVGQTVLLGEKAKDEQYDEFYKFPKSVKFVPFVIDSHGRFGSQAIQAMKAICLKSTGGYTNALYAKRLSWMIDNISMAHKRAIGARIAWGVRECAKKYCRADSRWGTWEYSTK